MHAAAHTSGQIGGISPSNKQLSATNEHMLLQFQLSHHNFYWSKSAVAFVRMTDAPSQYPSYLCLPLLISSYRDILKGKEKFILPSGLKTCPTSNQKFTKRSTQFTIIIHRGSPRQELK